IVISSELADYNKVKVGDKITLVSPEDETKKVTFTIKGVYESNEVDEDENVMSMGNYNRIYISYNALDKVCDLLGIEGKIAGEYSFDSVANYEKFESEVKDLGLSDDFTVKSDDITSFEKSIEPLDNLSKFAGVFLILVLGIGSIVLIGINIYGIRERKYEVGVLTAMGMKKHKVAMQFITETVVIALLAIIIGTSIGLISAKPITNNLLANQTITATEEENFGRKMGPEGGGMNRSGTKDVEQIKEVNMDVDSVVIIEVLLIGLLVSVIASGGAIGFITKYEPLSILADRD
ncbi:MAG: FtsX-like permease family protein, partial [Bacilli bacterium]